MILTICQLEMYKEANVSIRDSQQQTAKQRHVSYTPCYNTASVMIKWLMVTSRTPFEMLKTAYIKPG